MSFFYFFFFLKKRFFFRNTLIFSAQNSIASILLSKVLNYKILVRNGNHPLGSLIYSENKFFSLISFFLKLIVYNFSNKIICNSNQSTEFFKKFIFPKSKVKFIANSTISSKSEISKTRENFIITAGRLSKQKDIQTLIKAFHLFSKKKTNYKLIIMGEGKLKVKLLELCNKLKIFKKVIFKNFVKNPKKLISLSKVYVCTSLYEGLPNSIIEALNFGTPVISSDCKSGPKEILKNGEYGYLFPIRNYHVLYRKLIYVCDNYDKAISKTKKGQKSLDRFKVNKVSHQYIKEINKLF